MADGDLPSFPTNSGDAIIQLSIRLGGMEQAIRLGVTHEKLMLVMNEHRREITETVKGSESHIRDLIESQTKLGDRRHTEFASAQDQRITNLITSMDTLLGSKVTAAVEAALIAREKAQAKAREEIDNKAKDAARGVRTIFGSTGAIFGGAIVIGALLFAKYFLHWSF